MDAEMVGGDMSDGEKSVKDTSKKKKPEWDAKKQRHKTWLWRYLGYADATGGGPTARGKDRWKLSSSDAKVVAAYRKRNAAVFVDVYEAIKDTTAAGKALRMQIETEFAEDRDGYGLLMYLAAYAAEISPSEIKTLKQRISDVKFSVRVSPDRWQVRCQRMHRLWLRIPAEKREGGEDVLVETLLDKVDEVVPAYVDFLRAFDDAGSIGRSTHIARRSRFLLEAHAAGLIKAKHLAGDAQAADLLTKPLDRKRFVALRTYLMNTDAQVNVTGKPGKEGGASAAQSISTKSSLAACASSPPASRRG